MDVRIPLHLKKILFSALIITIDFTSTGASVVIQKNGADGTLYKSLTLSCKFDKDTFAVEWLHENDVTTIAHCVQKSCKLNPKYDGVYKITSDMEECVFNLTLPVVTMKNNGSKLICSDGSNTDSHVIKVKENEPLLVEDFENGTIQAVSGCLFSDKEVSFRWTKNLGCLNTDGGNCNITEEEISVIDNRIETCSNTADCSKSNKNRYIEVVHAERSENGQYLKVEAIYGKERKVVYHTDVKYSVFEGQDGEPMKNSYSFVYAVITVVILLVTTLLICLLIKLRRKINMIIKGPNNNRRHTNDDVEHVEVKLPAQNPVLEQGPKSDEQQSAHKGYLENESFIRNDSEVPDGENETSAMSLQDEIPLQHIYRTCRQRDSGISTLSNESNVSFIKDTTMTKLSRIKRNDMLENV